MKRAIIILTVIAFALIETNGQNTEEQLDSIVAKFKDSLKNKGVTEIGYVKNYCIGYKIFWDNKNEHCDYKTTYFSLYFFWKTNNNTFMKKFDNCGEFNQIQISESNFLNFYFDNKETIKNEKVKRFQIAEIKENGDTAISLLIVNHSCHLKLVIYDKNEIVSKHINKYDLSEVSQRKQRNINYTHNTNLKLVKWMYMTQKEIKRVNDDKKFTRLK